MKRGANDVAGQRAQSTERLTTDVASYLDAIRGHAKRAGTKETIHRNEAKDRVLMAEFNDFMGAESKLASGVQPLPDPVFRERLRRRLWRAHVVAHLAPSGGELH